MCLAIPAKITRIINTEQVEVDIGGIRRPASIALVPDAKPGNYVVLHAGFALTILDEEEAKKTLALFEQFAEGAE